MGVVSQVQVSFSLPLKCGPRASSSDLQWELPGLGATVLNFWGTQAPLRI